jgi:hypothetical protein
MVNRDDERNTAYTHNTRAQAPQRRLEGRWHPAIQALFERDYAFLGYCYGDSGVLFRGIACGVSEMLGAGQWMANCDDSHVGALERGLGVYLLSHELSDALAVARLWQANEDAAVLVFDAGEYNRRCEQGGAAMLGFAEPGVVFKYPFLVDPLPIAATGVLLLSSAHPPLDDESIALRVPAALLGDRGAVEQWARRVLDERGMNAAVPQPTGNFPR